MEILFQIFHDLLLQVGQVEKGVGMNWIDTKSLLKIGFSLY